MSVITDFIPATLPTYSKRYIVGGVNRLGREYHADIFERSEKVTTPVTLYGVGDDGIVINWSYPNRDFLNNIPGGSCQIVVQVNIHDQLKAIENADDSEWIVEVYEKNALDVNTLLFRGYIIPQTYSQEHGYEKPLVRFTATDGLGALKDIDFLSDEKVEGDDITFSHVIGSFPIKDIISYLLYKAGNRSNWRDCIAYTMYPEGMESLGGTAINYTYYFEKDVWAYYGKSCHEVLTDILSIMEAQVVFINGKYHIRLPDKPNYSHYNEYSYRGVLDSGDTHTENEIDIYTGFQGAFGTRTTEGNAKNLILERKFRKWDNLIYNGDFKKGDEGWLKEGEAFPWAGFTVGNEIAVLTPVTEAYWLANFWNSNFPSMATNIDKKKNITAGWVNIKFEVRRNVPDDYSPGFPSGIAYELYVGSSELSPVKVQWTSTDDPDEWHEVSAIMSINTQGATNYFHIYPRYHSVSIRNIEMTPRGSAPDYDELVDELDDVKIEINQNNRMNKVYPMSYFLSGSPYRYQNMFPGRGFATGDLVDRVTGVQVRAYDVVKDRLVEHFLIPRKRMNIKLVRHSTSMFLHPDIVLYDKYLETVFHIIQYNYNLRLARYDCQLFEYKKKALEEKWILEEGEWDDNKFWEDGEKWNDGFYSVTFIVVDSVSGLPVEGAEVKVDDLDGLTDNEGKLVIDGISEATHPYLATKAGYNDYNDTEIFDDYDMEINIQLVPL